METLFPDLPDELAEEILFRLPPDEPACFFRLPVISNAWRRLLSDPTFHHRYRKFHRTPPMLGLIYNEFSHSERISFTHFVPTPGSFPPWTFDPQLANMFVCDCRHGRVLLDDGKLSMKLVVWDPMTGRRTELSDPRESLCYIVTAVLCAVDSCDHTTCHEGPFHVVFIGMDAEVRTVTAYKYSSESGEWSAPTSELALVGELDIAVELDPVDKGYVLQSVLVEDTLHFLLRPGPQGARILKYDLGRHCLSLIAPPAGAAVYERGTILMATEDGRLGVAHLDKLFLHLWSREGGPDGVATWVEHRVIDLLPCLSIEGPVIKLELCLSIGDPAIKVELIGSVEGANIIFATTALGIYAIDLKLLCSRKLCEGKDIQPLFPFMSFYSPPVCRMTKQNKFFGGGASVAARDQ